jgi:hypothetical protein
MANVLGLSADEVSELTAAARVRPVEDDRLAKLEERLEQVERLLQELRGR